MKSSIKKLQNVFNLESDRDYDNGAVLGGLDRMLESWEAEARADNLSDELIQAVIARLRDYPRLTSSSREEALKGLWNRIKREEHVVPQTAQPAAEEGQEDRPGEESLPEPESKKVGAPDESQPAPEPPADPPRSPSAPQARPQETGQPQAAVAEAAVDRMAALDAPVTVLQGVGERHAQTLARLGLHTLGDMLYHFPRRYDDYTQIKPINRLWFGEEVTVIGTVKTIQTRAIHKKGLRLVEATVTDGSGGIKVTWFNQPWIGQRLKSGTSLVLSGKVEQYLGRLTMNNPEWELLERETLHTNRIVPVYPLTARLSQRWLRRVMHKVVSYWAPRVVDPLPASLREEAGLMDLSTALLQIHFPESQRQLSDARHRLAFDEIFLLQLGAMRQKSDWKSRDGRLFQVPNEWLQAALAALPFELTGAQDQALQDVRADLQSGQPMNRLLQGDVGSGKTVIAGLAVAMVVREGAQAAVMAPTSILAEQHFSSLTRQLVRESGIQPDQIRLLLGSTPEAEKAEMRSGLESGQIKLIIGTHALIEDPVGFSDLGLVVIDEQHRFGVQQRAALRDKGANPHLLVMTATPIPRSLSLTIYGDLDLTVLDEMPPGRQPVETHILFPLERERAYTLIAREVQAGRQAFVIYPLVQETEKTDARAAVEEHQRLEKEVFPTFEVGLLHGRLKPDEKESVMARFRDKEFHILVSTSVIEVGVDIPEATVMIIEGANRFGLAQLHQFRGRVGRGGHQSYCLLIPESDDSAENERLAAMVESNDGFVLAERDLEQRGPGEFLGTRQSGYSELRLANLTDLRLIEKARRLAHTLFEQDPDLTAPEHQLLSGALESFWQEGMGDIS